MSRVLIVDDDPAILRLLEVNFRLEGFEVATAGHGEAALADAAATPPDVVVLDVMMPGMDGRSVFTELRSRNETASVPVLFLTARNVEDTVVHEPGVRVMQKPFDAGDLVATVRSMLTEGG
jgi:two-component system OmpR family response regulator